MVTGLSDEIARSGAVKIYICNIMTQPGETDGYNASAHVKAIMSHAGKVVDNIVVNRGDIPRGLRDRYSKEGAAPVVADVKEIEKMGLKAVLEPLLASGDVVRHDHDRLARLILKLVLKNRK